MRLRGIDHRREVALPLTCKGLALETSHRLDLLVEDLAFAGCSTAESSISFVRPSCSSCLRAPATQTGSGPGAEPKSAAAVLRAPPSPPRALPGGGGPAPRRLGPGGRPRPRAPRPAPLRAAHPGSP